MASIKKTLAIVVIVIAAICSTGCDSVTMEDAFNAVNEVSSAYIQASEY